MTPRNDSYIEWCSKLVVSVEVGLSFAVGYRHFRTEVGTDEKKDHGEGEQWDEDGKDFCKWVVIDERASVWETEGALDFNLLECHYYVDIDIDRYKVKVCDKMRPYGKRPLKRI